MGALLALNELDLGEFLSSFPRAYSLLSLSLSFSLFPIVLLSSREFLGWYHSDRNGRPLGTGKFIPGWVFVLLHVLIFYSLSISHSLLSRCCLGRNSLSGTIPTELGALTKLTRLSLGKFWNWLDWISMNVNNPVLTHARIVCFAQRVTVWGVIWISCALKILNGCPLLSLVTLKMKMEVFWIFLVLAVLFARYPFGTRHHRVSKWCTFYTQPKLLAVQGPYNEKYDPIKVGFWI
jgi:hypothetical protein